jgi:hypothetical protein
MTDVRAIKSAVAALAGRESQAKTLPAKDGTTPLPAVVGQGRMRLNGSAVSPNASAGIASPLTEPDAATRTYHAARIVTTTDGVFTFEIEDLATIAMTDANGRDVALEFDAPA